MSKALKHMLASQLEADLETSPHGLMLIDPGAMSMEANEAFRKDLREKAGGARMRVIHNRTARVTIQARGWDGDVGALTKTLAGPSAVVYGGDGPIPIAKVVREWGRRQKDLKVKGAVAYGEILLDADALALADMPDLDQLRGMLASAIIGAARGIAGSLQAVYAGLARVLQARVEQQGDGTQADGTQGDGTQADGTQADGTQGGDTQGDGTQSDGTQAEESAAG